MLCNLLVPAISPARLIKAPSCRGTDLLATTSIGALQQGARLVDGYLPLARRGGSLGCAKRSTKRPAATSYVRPQCASCPCCPWPSVRSLISLSDSPIPRC